MCPHVIGTKNGDLNAFFFNLRARASWDYNRMDSGGASVWMT